MVAPANDNFSSAEVLSGLAGSAAFTTVDATLEAGEPDSTIDPYGSGDLLGQTVWFTHTPADSGILTIDVTGDGGSADTVLEVFTGSTLTGLTLVTSDDDSGDGAQSHVSFAVTGGVPLQIRVDSWTYQGPIVAGLIAWSWAMAGHTTVLVDGTRYGIITPPNVTVRRSGGDDPSTGFESYDDDLTSERFVAGDPSAYFAVYGMLAAVDQFFHTNAAHDVVELRADHPVNVWAFVRTRLSDAPGSPPYPYSLGTYVTNGAESHIFRDTVMNVSATDTTWLTKIDSSNLAALAHFFDDLAAGDVRWYLTYDTTTAAVRITTFGLIYELLEDLGGGWQVGSVTW